MSEPLDVLLGQKEIADGMFRALGRDDVRLIRLTGEAGSGKSHIARMVGARWHEEYEGACVFAVGDNEQAWRELFPFLTGLSRAPIVWSNVIESGSRSVATVAGSTVGAGGIASSIFDLLATTFRHQLERALRQYLPLEREVILDLRRISRSRPVLLIADNAHWWDPDSLRLLSELLSDRLRQAIPRLHSIKVLVVDTAAEQTKLAPSEFDSVTARVTDLRWDVSRCPAEKFGAVLREFGAPQGLSSAAITELFDATNGHLKLAEQIGSYEAQGRVLAAEDGILDDDFLSTLVDARFSSLGAVSPDVVDTLTRAAVLGLSCSEKDLQCLTNRGRSELRFLIRSAESIGFLERTTERVAFSHEVIRSAVLDNQSPTHLEELHLKLAQCLRTLKPGDYAARGQALLRAGESEDAREMYALASVSQIRQGIPGAKVLKRLTLLFPGDDELMSFVSVIADGYSAVAAGDYGATGATVQAHLSGESSLMLAERKYLSAVLSLGLQTIEGAKRAQAEIRAWIPALEDEFELEMRYLILLQQAQVLSEMFDDALATESRIQQELTTRISYDRDAATMVQVQNRRAGGLMEPSVAEERIEIAERYFRQEAPARIRGRVELFRTLTNLAAIKIRLGKDAEAYARALDAERLAIESPEVRHRLDVLASNLVLAGLRSGASDLEETIRKQELIVESPDSSDDSFMASCNLIAYRLLASDDAKANAELDSLQSMMRAKEITETYLVYYWSALSVAAAAVSGNIEETMIRHHSMSDFVAGLRWPAASYIRRRHALMEEFLPRMLTDVPRTDADRLILDPVPGQVGRAWEYYGRLFPCCELSFWADS